jgi:hypothetical protein
MSQSGTDQRIVRCPPSHAGRSEHGSGGWPVQACSPEPWAGAAASPQPRLSDLRTALTASPLQQATAMGCGGDMPFRDAAYDPDTITLMTTALDAAWHEAQVRRLTKASAETPAARWAGILSAVAHGERARCVSRIPPFAPSTPQGCTDGVEESELPPAFVASRAGTVCRGGVNITSRAKPMPIRTSKMPGQ